MDKRRTGFAIVVAGVLAAGAWFFFQTQKVDTSAVGTRSAPPALVGADAGAATVRYVVADRGSASFLIDAPLEKIKGHASHLRGVIDLDVGALERSRGEIDVDLDSLVTETFGDPAKDKAQTEHAHNWMELGGDAASPEHETNRWARFTFSRAALEAMPTADAGSTTRLSDLPLANGKAAPERHFTVTATGDFWLHGVTAAKTVKLTVSTSGPDGESPAKLHVETATAMPVSLKEHDVKPRDVAGKFLAGSLEKVGDKITDTAAVSMSFDAFPAAASTLDASLGTSHIADAATNK